MLVDGGGRPDCILIATGSEVALAVEAARELASRGRKARVVSMPCTSVFDTQDAAWRDAVLPPDVGARVAIEAGVPDGWWRYVGPRGRVVGMMASARRRRPRTCSGISVSRPPRSWKRRSHR